MDTAMPSPDLLRSLTDEHVLRALMRQRRMTRAELAAATGISKPAVGECVRRLAEAGLVADTGERTPGGRGRGRVGTYYALAGGAGEALAVSIAPEGIVAEAIDAYGDTAARATADTGRPARPERVVRALRSAAGRVSGGDRPAARAAVVSVAGPVDRATGRLVRLPDEPFLLGDLDPAAVLEPYVSGPVLADNDVNWAARAERDSAGGTADDFAYLFLGEGLGAATVSNGEVIRGHAGLAGEVAHIVTAGPAGQAMPLIEVFGALGLRQPGSTAIDTARLLAAAGGEERQAVAVRHILGQAMSGALAALIALTDPQLVIIGGPWGSQPVIVEAITAAAGCLPRPVPVRAARVTSEPSLAGARAEAHSALRSAILATAREAAFRFR